MGFFKSREEKYEQQMQDIQRERNNLELKYGVKLLNKQDFESAKIIDRDSKATGQLDKVQVNSAKRAEVNYLSMIYHQNWILIRQLAELNKKLDNK